MKFITVLRSRFLKNDEESWVKERRDICKHCGFCTVNIAEIPFKVKLARWGSNFLNYILFKWNTIDRGTCSICLCPITEKSREPDENCPAENRGQEDKWKSIYIPNKK